jgi:hypothetical protein
VVGPWLLVDADNGDIRLRFKNLLAIKSTGRQLVLDDRLTTTNLVGSLFTQLFGTAWEPQADTTFGFGARDPFELVAIDDPDAADLR